MFALKSSHGGNFFFISRLELGDELLKIKEINEGIDFFSEERVLEKCPI